MTNSDKIARQILKAMEDQELSDIGLAVTQAMSIFLAFCELDHEGGAESAKKLLLSGIDKLSAATLIDVNRMKTSGMNRDEIREALFGFLTDSGTKIRKTKDEATH